jgi:hypothetical protein
MGDLTDTHRFTTTGTYLKALHDGITVIPVQTSIAGKEQVDVYRLVANGHLLGGTPLPVEPVADASEWFENIRERYAYDEILFLASLCSTRKFNNVICLPGMALVLRNALDHAADVVDKIAAAGREPVICSELVYRIYRQAGDNYGILVLRGADVPSLAAFSLAESEDENVVSFLKTAMKS